MNKTRLDWKAEQAAAIKKEITWTSQLKHYQAVLVDSTYRPKPRGVFRKRCPSCSSRLKIDRPNHCIFEPQCDTYLTYYECPNCDYRYVATHTYIAV